MAGLNNVVIPPFWKTQKDLTGKTRTPKQRNESQAGRLAKPKCGEKEQESSKSSNVRQQRRVIRGSREKRSGQLLV